MSKQPVSEYLKQRPACVGYIVTLTHRETGETVSGVVGRKPNAYSTTLAVKPFNSFVLNTYGDDWYCEPYQGRVPVEGRPDAA